jgi:signal transduction histidine kinase
LTADSLLPRTAAAIRVEPKPAAYAQMASDLVAEACHRAQAAGDEHALRLDLEAIERAFGRQLLDERTRAGVDTARSRALRLAKAGGGRAEAVGMAFAADLFVSLAVERPWRARDVGSLVTGLAPLFGAPEDLVAVQLFVGSLRAPQLLELPPLVALDVQLATLVAFSATIEASIWTRDEAGRPELLLSLGETATTRRFRSVALRTLEGRETSTDRGLIVGVAIRRFQAPWAALVARIRMRGDVEALLDEASTAMSPILERDFLLQRSAGRERTLVKASERRLSRLGFDLHDGALQHIAVLGADLRALKAQVLPAGVASVDGIERRVRELDRVLRELAHSLEPASLLRRPLERVIQAEADSLAERTGIQIRARVIGDFGAMTQSQKIALIRVVQEALANIREHSNATTVDLMVMASRSCVELQIEDDGDGFEVTRTLQNAAQRGRLGLVGSSERVRLLGGTFDIRSRPGGPTAVAVTLPRWQPLVAEEGTLQLAY